MTYRLEWCLVGRAGRHLDSGEIDEAFSDRTSALQALNGFLLTFAVRGRNEAEGYWWGRRSADADIEVQVVLRHPVLPTSDAPAPLKLVASQEASSDLLLKPAIPRGGENDIRRPDVTLPRRTIGAGQPGMLIRAYRVRGHLHANLDPLLFYSTPSPSA